jgi:hypothetical protein
MKATAFRYLNDIISLIVLVLMAVALIAGQAEATAHAASGHESAGQTTSFRHDGE